MFNLNKYLNVRITISILVFVATFLLSTVNISALNTYDLATTSNYNIKIDGLADDVLLSSNFTVADITNDGVPDLILGAGKSDYNGRTNSGSVYVISGDKLDDFIGTGNTLDLANPANYLYRFDGAAANDQLGFNQIYVTNIYGDSKLELLIPASQADFGGNLARTDAGSVYIFSNSFLNATPPLSKTYDLANSANFNIRIDGDTVSPFLSAGLSSRIMTFADIKIPDGIGYKKVNTILIPQFAANHNGRYDSGSIFILDKTMFSSVTGTGNIYDLASSDNFMCRLDGEHGGDLLNGGDEFSISLIARDFDGNGDTDLVVGADWSSNTPVGYIGPNHYHAGSAYIILDSILTKCTGGAVIDMAETNISGDAINYNIRFDGPPGLTSGGAWTGRGSWFGRSSTAGYFNNPNELGLAIGAPFFGSSNGSYSGAVYIINSVPDLLSQYPGTGNVLDITNPANYNIRLLGAATNSQLAQTRLYADDFFNTGTTDLMLSSLSSPSGKSFPGSMIMIKNDLLNPYDSFGNTVDLINTANYSLRFDGDVNFAALMHYENPITSYSYDLNGDNSKDFILGASQKFSPFTSFAGRLYIIYNFPHTINLDLITSPRTPDTLNLTGLIEAPNSITNISMVQYSLDNNTFAGGSDGWQNCTANDSIFNSKSEYFSCSLTNISEGPHTVYVRAYDENGSYTALSKYTSQNFIRDITPPTILLNPVTSPSSNTSPVVTGISTDIYSKIDTVAFQVDSTSGTWFNCSVGSNLSLSEAFSCTITPALSEGTHVIYFTSADMLANAIQSNYPYVIIKIEFPSPETSSNLTINITSRTIINNLPVYKGVATDLNAIITSVNYQVDQTTGLWTICTADDGAFDSNYEEFTCQITTPLSDGTHIIYFQATDSVGNTAETNLSESSSNLSSPTPTSVNNQNPTPTQAPVTSLPETGTQEPIIPIISVALITVVVVTDPKILQRIVLLATGFLNRKKSIWGDVYDSNSKELLVDAIVSIVNSSGKKYQTVTDRYGRYDFSVPSGKYSVDVNKKGYTFPSTVITEPIYKDVLIGTTIEIENKRVVRFNIPIDISQATQNVTSTQVESLPIVQKLLNNLYNILMFCSFVWSMYAVIVDPSIFNFIIVGLSSLICLYRLLRSYI